MSSRDLDLATRLVHLPARHGGPERPGLAPVLERSTTFRLDEAGTRAMVSGEGRGGLDIYGRYGTETTREAAALIAELEGGEAGLMFSSGMGAISAAFNAFASAGSRVAVSRDVYGGTEAVCAVDLPQRGISVGRFDACEPTSLEALIEAEGAPELVWAETLSNPLLKVADIAGLAAVCERVGARLVVDGTFSAGIAVRPLELGAHVVVHSATKYIGGHSDVIAGAAVGSAADVAAIYDVMARQGSCIDPMGAWLIARGLRTLTLRFERQSATANELARRLVGRPGVRAVNYPGVGQRVDDHIGPAGGVFSFELQDGEAVTHFVKQLKVCTHAVSLGGVETLVGVPRQSSHVGRTPAYWDSLGIRDGLVRVAVGLEAVDDIWSDFAEL